MSVTSQHDTVVVFLRKRTTKTNSRVSVVGAGLGHRGLERERQREAQNSVIHAPPPPASATSVNNWHFTREKSKAMLCDGLYCYAGNGRGHYSSL